MGKSQPCVSIVIPVYNSGQYVVSTLDSIVQQSYPLEKLQVIVIDDASTDNSVELIKSWIINNPDLNCVHEINVQNLGLNRTLNKGIKEFVKHEYLILIGDDIILKDKIGIQIESLEKNPTCAFCFSDMEMIDEKGTRIASSYFLENYNIDINQFDFSNLYERMLSNNVIPAPSIMHRKSILDEVGYFDEALTFEDYDMNLRILKKYEAIFVSESLVQYRCLAKSMSKDIYKELRHLKTYFLIFQKHLDYDQSYDYIVKRMNWFLEKLYVNNADDLDSLAEDFLKNHSTDNLLKSCVLSKKSVLYFRIARKFKKLNN